MTQVYCYKDVDFVKVPKAATRSVLRALSTKSEVDGYLGPYTPREGIPSFAIVRNPYDRFCSAVAMFHDKVHRGFGERVRGVDVEKAIRLISGKIPFTKNDQDYYFVYRHLEPYSRFNLGQVTKIFRFEELEKTWPELLEFAGLPSDTPLTQVGARKKDIWLTDAEKRQLAAYYHEDFKQFGYEK